jgi:hypothetical protein
MIEDSGLEVHLFNYLLSFLGLVGLPIKVLAPWVNFNFDRRGNDEKYLEMTGRVTASCENCPLVPTPQGP